MDNNLTEYEFLVLNTIVHAEMSSLNGFTPKNYEDIIDGTYTWLDHWSNYCNLPINTIKGVVGSLHKKNLVNSEDNNTEDAAIWLTEDGYDLWKLEFDRRVDSGILNEIK